MCNKITLNDLKENPIILMRKYSDAYGTQSHRGTQNSID